MFEIVTRWFKRKPSEAEELSQMYKNDLHDIKDIGQIVRESEIKSAEAGRLIDNAHERIIREYQRRMEIASGRKSN